jgi:peptidylprolyl isomerase
MGSLFGKKQETAGVPGTAGEFDRIIALETTQGTMEIRLKPQVAPKACENFVKLVQKGYYNGTVFHRIIKGFMIQGGDPEGTGSGGSSIWGGQFKDEVSPAVKFDRPGLLAMANRGPDTNGSQFFITTGKPGHLNMKHTIFGEVVSGLEVVQKLDAVETNGKPQNRPVSPQKIMKAYVKA